MRFVSYTACIWLNMNSPLPSVDMVGKTVYFLSAAGEAAIALQDNSQALTYLREAQILVDEMKTGESIGSFFIGF